MHTQSSLALMVLAGTKPFPVKLNSLETATMRPFADVTEPARYIEIQL